MKQSQPLRIESEIPCFCTTRTANSRLWFVTNPTLDSNICARLAQYREKYEVKLYSFVMQGNHYHLTGAFPGLNRAKFFRDFNARIAEQVKKDVPNFPGGKLWARRYSAEAVPSPEDVEEQFFYCALQPVRAGLCTRISDYPGYNSFHDAICGTSRKFKIVDWEAFHSQKRFNKKIHIRDFTKDVVLKYDRLPGYEHLTQKQYRKLMLEKLEKRRQAILRQKKLMGHKFPAVETLREIPAGAHPVNTKVSRHYSFRPQVLAKRRETRYRFLAWFYAVYVQYKYAADKYLKGDRNAEFPPGTYPPPLFLVPPD